MVKNCSIGEIAIKGEIARYLFRYYPIEQVDTELSMVTKWMLKVTLLTFTEAPEVERVVFATGMHIRGE